LSATRVAELQQESDGHRWQVLRIATTLQNSFQLTCLVVHSQRALGAKSKNERQISAEQGTAGCFVKLGEVSRATILDGNES
jgi:hypothetical protein